MATKKTFSKEQLKNFEDDLLKKGRIGYKHEIYTKIKFPVIRYKGEIYRKVPNTIKVYDKDEVTMFYAPHIFKLMNDLNSKLIVDSEKVEIV